MAALTSSQLSMGYLVPRKVWPSDSARLRSASVHSFATESPLGQIDERVEPRHESQQKVKLGLDTSGPLLVVHPISVHQEVTTSRSGRSGVSRASPVAWYSVEAAPPMITTQM